MQDSFKSSPSVWWNSCEAYICGYFNYYDTSEYNCQNILYYYIGVEKTGYWLLIQLVINICFDYKLLCKGYNN